MNAHFQIPRFWLVIEAIGALVILATMVMLHHAEVEKGQAILLLILGVIFMLPALIILFCKIARKLAPDLLNLRENKPR